MATIPIGNFGQAVARPGPMVNTPQGNPIGQAVDRLDQIAGGVANDMERQRLVKADTEQKTLDAQQRARAMVGMATAANELHSVHDEVSRGVLDGSIPTDKAGAEFSTRASKVTNAIRGEYTPEQQATIEGHLTGVSGTLQRNLGAVVQKRQQTETASAIDQFGEQMSREAARAGPAWASEKFGAMVDFTGDAAGLNPAQQAKLKQAFTERAHATFFESAGTAALTKGDTASLQALREQVAGPQGDVLDPVKRTQLTHQFFTWEKQIDGMRGREQDASAKLAAEEVAKLRTFVADGQSPDIAYQNQVRMLTRGTPWAADAEALIEAGNAGAGFGAQSLPRQAAALAGMEGQPTNPETAKQVAHARTIYEKQSAAYKDDPWEAGARFQRLPPVVATPILAPLQLLKIATERVPLMNSLEASSGQPAPLLRPAEVPQAIAQLQGASIRDRTEILGQIGSMLSTERLAAFADQLDKGSKPLALTLKLGTDRTTAGRLASELVQVGAQALADKTVKKDESALSGWRADIAGLVRGTLGNDKAEGDIIDAAYYIRAAQELDSAKAPGFTKGFGSGAEDAITMVIGKPIERAGVKTFLPKGMDEAAFDTKARAMLAAGAGQTVYLRGQPVRVEELSNRWSGYGVQMVRPGEYMPVLNNAPITVDKEGRQPLRLRVQ